MTSAQIRRQFIDFFVQKHRHTFVPSSPVVPQDDPTLLFTNAGMNQFKPIFLGTAKPPYTRAANTQKCIRAGGKHNDLDDVGRSRRHHTFFEMLGNWSFGDYFKQGAIEMAWELLTKVWKLDPSRLHVSCFEGDEKNGVPRDTEAADIWKQVAKLPDDHIHYFGKDNFWEMGDTGPCGPCTEIYYDRTEGKTGGPQVNGEDPRVMEIWNLVFIQYNRNPDRSLVTLPAQHVDTGMGFERITQVLQNVDSNYSIDLWHPFWAKLKDLSGHTYSGKFTKTNSVDAIAEAADEGLRKDIAFRVIADHARCLTFALTDGAVPSNEGRGYVLRRILRRAVFYGTQHLQLNVPFLCGFVPVVVDAMANAFPELNRDPEHVVEIIKQEEIAFAQTLERGLGHLEEAIAHAVARFEKGSALRQQHPETDFDSHLEKIKDWPEGDVKAWAASFSGQPTISAVDAFKLHDTYGFLIDLTLIRAAERGIAVDMAGYEVLMEEARRRARVPKDAGLILLRNVAAVVEDVNESPKYDHDPIESVITAVITPDYCVETRLGHEVSGAVGLLVRTTPFYAEQGGQVGDRGTITTNEGVFQVEDTIHQWNNVLHLGRTEWGTMKVGDLAVAKVDPARTRTEKNHTATHLANWALREVLGEGVQQKGSLVDPDKLRFDFSYGQSLGEDQLERVEQLVNQNIAKKLPVYAENAPQEQALKINGLRAVFGEKYPPMVRVVSIGAPVADLLKDPANPKWREFSVEFCGGTHLKNATDAGAFAITAEESVSKGVRRIVAVTGEAAKAMLAREEVLDLMLSKATREQDDVLSAVIPTVQKMVIPGELSLRARRRLQTTIAELQDRQKKWEKANRAQSASKIDIGEISAKLLSDAPALGPGKLIVGDVPGATAEQLLSLTDSLKKKSGSYAILLGSAADGKVSFVAAVSDDLIAKGLKAGDWIRQAAQATGGGGGGRPQMAQAGGKDPAKLPDALKLAEDHARRSLTGK